ncbi:MAG: DegT/DnrJ/EryC1/StrS family aminotransferase [Deltaproteobacteria bacterium]|nr:DegT/DnrJ/EryC1/StrS family aminotransferase [Deltaproteobacteria bacterium]
MIKLSPPEIDETDLAAVRDVLNSRWLVKGPQAAAFERELAAWVGAKHVVAVSSGTAAIQLALQALGIGAGDEVIVPSLTYPATVHAVALCGATPRLVDVDGETWNIDPSAAAAAFSARTKAVLPVDLCGAPADLAALSRALPDLDNRAIVDDAACALGAERDGVRCCADATLACVSFHPRKVITTGEGGAVFTDDDQLAATLRRLRDHGRDTAGRFVAVAGNHRLSEMAAALGRAQLRRIDRFLERRAALVAQYKLRLKDHSKIRFQQLPNGFVHGYQTLAVELGAGVDRDAVIARMREHGVETTLGSFAAHLEPVYRDAGVTAPHSERLTAQLLALPLYPSLTETEVDTVCQALEKAI